MSLPPAEEKEVTPAGAAHLKAKRHFSESMSNWVTTDVAFWELPSAPHCSPWGRAEELSSLSFHFISPLFPWAENAFFLAFPAQLDPPARLSPVVSWPHFAAMPVLARLPNQNGSRGSSLGKGKKPLRVFGGSLHSGKPPKVPFQAPRNPSLPRSPGQQAQGEVTSLAGLMLSL